MLLTYQLAEIYNSLPSQLKDCKGWFLAGGAASFLNHSDIDIFFESEDYFNEAVKVFESDMQNKYETDNAISFDYTREEDNTPFLSTRVTTKFQFICKQFGTVDEILSGFDINVCRNAILPDGTYIQHPTAHKALYIDRPSNTTNARLMKYLHRGAVLDTTKFKNLVRVLALNPNDKLAIDYNHEGATKQYLASLTYLKLLDDLVSNPNLASLCFEVIDTLDPSTREFIYQSVIREYSEYLPNSLQSEELQYMLSSANPKYATPLIQEKFPEIFI